jgi:cysteine desulfurase / selenocysteine lyase
MSASVRLVEQQSSRCSGYDVKRVRADFPILHQSVRGKPLVYLDNGATSQKPSTVIDAVGDYYRSYNANVHRGVHHLSQLATDAYERARKRVAQFINAPSAREIVFVRGATEGINLVAQTFGRSRLKGGDEILLTRMEHHSNIVPWQMLCEQTGAVLKVASIDDAGEVDMSHFESLLSERTRLVAVGHMSNALGTINPVQRMVELAHAAGAKVLVDGAQAVPHLPVDVQALDCDFYVLSGHKAYGPTGIGALYGRRDLLESMPPYQGGGDMIRAVTFEKTVYNDVPFKFEAGTPHIAGAIGLAAALDYLSNLGIEAVRQYEHDLLAYATEAVGQVHGLRIIGTAREKGAILSFVLDRAHPHDVGTIMDHEGVAIRAGHHCAMPVMQHFRIPATARASFACYNTREEVDSLVQAIQKVRELFP